jgi:hypothetical protein
MIGLQLHSELLAGQLEADVFIMVTDAERFRREPPKAMRGSSFSRGSIGAKGRCSQEDCRYDW